MSNKMVYRISKIAACHYQQTQILLISYKLQQIKLNMRKGKTKNNNLTNKNQPLNINISFNINPKNILHQQHSLDLKLPSNTQSDHTHFAAKNKLNRQKKIQYENNQAEHSQRTNKNVGCQSSGEAEINKKELQKIKKKFLNKINNMDIMLMPAPVSNKEEIEEEDEKQSSLMSAKMVQYQNNGVKKSSESLQLNFNSIHAKSKIINNQVSKILPAQSFKKTKLDRKPPMMTQSKNITHMKGYSTFTDIKGSPQRHRRKKAKTALQSYEHKKVKVKQQNLQQKLDRFKVDMMKLAMVYDQGQVLKTKFSSQYHNNIRSRQISKQVVDVGKINQGQLHQKLEQIKQFQATQSNQLTPKEQSQSFKHLKDVYQDLNKKKQIQSQDKECTSNIVEYYTQITTDPKYIYDQFKQEQSEVSSDSYNSSQPSSESSKRTQENIIIPLPAECSNNQKQINFQQFIIFLQKKMENPKDGAKISQQLNNLIHQYTKNNPIMQVIQPQKPLQTHAAISTNLQNLNVDSIDDQINKQIRSISNLKDDLIENCNMNGDQIFQLQIWEENYKNELLKIKGKMWRQYKTIKTLIQGRIEGNNQSQTIQTRKTKKQNKIMKCLSQKFINKNYASTDQSIQPLAPLPHQTILPKVQQQQKFVARQQHLSVQVSLSQQNSQQHSELQLFEGQPSLLTSTKALNSFQKQDNMLISSLVRVEMQKAQERQSPYFKKAAQTISSKHRLTNQDKEDIFQFIFLDICIQLYQDAIEKQQQLCQKASIVAAERILKSIKNYLTDQKKSKTEKEKKIGISTTVSTIKKVVQQISQFILSDTYINKSPLTIKQRVIHKLNLPLGPSQGEILKSLRLSLFNNQPVDDYGEDIQEADLLVLEPQLFIYFQNQIIKIQELAFPKYYEDQKRDEQRINFLRNCTHIHQKAIFDCINENLDYHRIYGIWGKPFIWKNSSLFHHEIKQKDLKKALSKSGAQVIKCSAFVCGLMVNKEDSLIKDIATDANYVRKLQDERIYKLLQNFVFQMEEKWFFHDDEQSEILIELSHIVWTLLLKEVMKQLNQFMK